MEGLRSDAAGPPDTQVSRQHFWPYRGREQDIRAGRAGAETVLGQEPGARNWERRGPPVPAPRCPGRPPLLPPPQLPPASGPAGSPRATGGGVCPSRARRRGRSVSPEGGAGPAGDRTEVALSGVRRGCGVSGAVPFRSAVPLCAVRAVPLCAVLSRSVPCRAVLFCAVVRRAQRRAGARVPANQRRHVSAPRHAAPLPRPLEQRARGGGGKRARRRARGGARAAPLWGARGSPLPCRRRRARPSCPRERSFPGIEGLRRQEILRGPVRGAAAMASPPCAGGWGPQPPPPCSVRASARWNVDRGVCASLNHMWMLLCLTLLTSLMSKSYRAARLSFPTQNFHAES